jgi:hypothetical protein
LITLALLATLTFDAAAIAQTTATLNALGPHAYGSPRNRAAAQFVGAKLQDAGLSETTIEDFEFEGSTGTNVVARIPGRSDRLLIVATHHDTKKDAQDVTGRSRTLALLIDLGRQASRLRPAKTWILASFDGGESNGEGLAHYLETLGRSRELVDGVLILDAAASGTAAETPAIIAPACPGGGAFPRRAIASRDQVEAALGGVPDTMDVSFDDAGISLLTQPFIRAFRTACDPMAGRALAAGAGVLMVGDVPYSRAFLAAPVARSSAETPKRDEQAVRLGDVALAAMNGLDAAFVPSPRTDSWLVVGRTVIAGWLVFLMGALALIPGLLAARGDMKRLALRGAYSAIFVAVLFREPEIALFAGLLPSLVPLAWPRIAVGVSLVPFGLLLAAGALSALRGQVTGTWLSLWLWAGLLGAMALLFVFRGGRAKAPSRAKRGRK